MRAPSRAGLAFCFIVSMVCRAHAADFSGYSGTQLYERFCASCHGPGGEGDGPVAPFLKLQPPDLTRMAQRSRGVFPEDLTRRIIDGREGVRPHGTREMPVWGWQFFSEEGGFKTETNAAVMARRRTDETIRRLVEYLRSIQKMETDASNP